MAVILAVNMLVIGIFGSYQTAQAAEIVAGYTALEVIEGILLSFGISIFTTEMVSTLTEDPKTAQDEYWRETQAAHWAEYMEAVYEEERKKGGGGSGPTPTPGVTGSDIPSFKEVIQNMKNTGKIVLGAAAGAGVWECMSKAVSSFWDKYVNNKTIVQDDYIPDWDSDYFVTTSGTFKQVGKAVSFCPLGGSNPYGVAYNYFTIYASPDATSLKLKKGNYYDEFEDNLGKIFVTRYDVLYYNTGQTETKKQTNQSFLKLYSPVIGSGYGYSFSSDLPVYVDDSDEPLNRNDGKEMIWVSPDLQDTYKNNGKLEYPQQAPQPLQIPSIAQLTDLANKLKTDPQQSPNSVQELIDQLKQNPQPQPTVAPNPNPNPDPNPDPNPNPEVTPKPDDTTTDVNPDDYKADLRLVFPFCIPFDLVHLIQAFEAEPEAPVFEFPFDLELENPWTGKKILDYHHVFKLDMSDYEPVIRIFRIFEIIFFIIGLLMITRQQMIKG